MELLHWGVARSTGASLLSDVLRSCPLASPSFFLFQPLVPPFLVLPLVLRPPPSPSTIFADIDEPPCALLSSTWTLPDETRLDVLGREIDRLGNRFSRVSGFFIPSFLDAAEVDVRLFISTILM